MTQVPVAQITQMPKAANSASGTILENASFVSLRWNSSQVEGATVTESSARMYAMITEDKNATKLE